MIAGSTRLPQAKPEALTSAVWKAEVALQHSLEKMKGKTFRSEQFPEYTFFFKPGDEASEWLPFWISIHPDQSSSRGSGDPGGKPQPGFSSEDRKAMAGVTALLFKRTGSSDEGKASRRKAGRRSRL